MDYEQKYKEAFERVKELLDNAKNQGHIIVRVEDIENAFPELKDSEDEESKNWILDYLYDGLYKTDEQFRDEFKAAIAWLEKQGHMLDPDKVIEWIYEHVPTKFEDMANYVQQFKEDFGL